MAPHTFGFAIEQFLAYEKDAIGRLVASKSFQSVTEVGCDDGRLVDCFMEMNIPYMGIDISESAIARAKSKYHSDQECFLCTDIHDYLSCKAAEEGVLYIYPFNLLGNFNDPEHLLALHKRADHSSVVACSMYSTSIQMTDARFAYYQKCFPEDSVLRFEDASTTTMRVENVFTSVAYSCVAMRMFTHHCNAFETIQYPDNLGYLALFEF